MVRNPFVAEVACLFASVSFRLSTALQVSANSAETEIADVLWDPALVNRQCLPVWMNETNTSVDDVCSDDATNNIKDDRGNYVQFTRREDRFMYNAWSGALRDCAMGQPYVRNIIESFAERTSCFTSETDLADDPSFYVTGKKLQDGMITVDTESPPEKVICPGNKKISSQSSLDERKNALRGLVEKWDSMPNGDGKVPLCKEMLAAHTNVSYYWVGVMKTTRPAVCNSSALFYDEELCKTSEEWFIRFRSRDLFSETTNAGFKGRAGEGENKHFEECNSAYLNGQKWYKHYTTNIGSTVDVPPCTIPTPEEVFPAPVLKVGALKYSMGNTQLGNLWRQCGVPFLAGVSATMPNYIVAAAGGPTKTGKKFDQALNMNEILTLMSMLELGGFHAVTGLTMSVNFYKGKLVVIPPFDSGDFEGLSDGQIRCHDVETNCCTNETKDAEGFYNHKTYLKMMEAWEEISSCTFNGIC
jgi:hypothetical protein